MCERCGRQGSVVDTGWDPIRRVVARRRLCSDARCGHKWYTMEVRIDVGGGAGGESDQKQADPGQEVETYQERARVNAQINMSRIRAQIRKPGENIIERAADFDDE